MSVLRRVNAEGVCCFAAASARNASTFKMRWQSSSVSIVGNPFRPPTFSSTWHTDTAVALALLGCTTREASARCPFLPMLLQDAGCDNEDILSHCRAEATHIRGCWVVDLVLGKS